MLELDTQPSLYINYDLNKNTALVNLYLELEVRIDAEIDILKKSYEMTLKMDDEYDSIEIFGAFNSRTSEIKAYHLDATLYLLKRTIFIKENIEDYIHLAKNRNKDDVDLIKLYKEKFVTIDDLLDYKTSCWHVDESLTNGGSFIEHRSLRETLNMSRTLSGIFNNTYAFFPALWGKTKSLIHFEKSLEKKETFDADMYKKYREKTPRCQKNPIQRLHEYHEFSLKPSLSITKNTYFLEKNGPL